jgi:hypothetical protein
MDEGDVTGYLSVGIAGSVVDFKRKLDPLPLGGRGGFACVTEDSCDRRSDCEQTSKVIFHLMFPVSKIISIALGFHHPKRDAEVPGQRHLHERIPRNGRFLLPLKNRPPFHGNRLRLRGGHAAEPHYHA